MRLNATALDRILCFLKVIPIVVFLWPLTVFNCVVPCFFCPFWSHTVKFVFPGDQQPPVPSRSEAVQEGAELWELKMLLILWASTRSVPGGCARGSNYVMPRAGSHESCVEHVSSNSLLALARLHARKELGFLSSLQEREGCAARPREAGVTPHPHRALLPTGVRTTGNSSHFPPAFCVCLFFCFGFYFSLLLDPEKKIQRKKGSF